MKRICLLGVSLLIFTGCAAGNLALNEANPSSVGDDQDQAQANDAKKKKSNGLTAVTYDIELYKHASMNLHHKLRLQFISDFLHEGCIIPMVSSCTAHAKQREKVKTNIYLLKSFESGATATSESNEKKILGESYLVAYEMPEIEDSISHDRHPELKQVQPAAVKGLHITCELGADGRFEITKVQYNSSVFKNGGAKKGGTTDTTVSTYDKNKGWGSIQISEEDECLVDTASEEDN